MVLFLLQVNTKWIEYVSYAVSVGKVLLRFVIYYAISGSSTVLMSRSIGVRSVDRPSSGSEI